MPSINTIAGSPAHEPQVATPLEQFIGTSSDESVSKALQWADHKTSQFNFQTGGFDKLTDNDVAAILLEKLRPLKPLPSPPKALADGVE